MRIISICFILLLCSGTLKSQFIFSPNDVKAPEDLENVFTEKIFSDELTSSFVIIIRKGVALHKHEMHSEHVYVLKGTGEMILGDENISVAEGDIIVIPKNTPHSLEVTSRDPMKIISFQAPLFEGNDRVLID